jgi:class 3 adenylate cyclase/tetratricopeptide (TPR) repeat protein
VRWPRGLGLIGVSIVERNAPDGRGTPTERRQLTILFCDLVGSTGLSTTLDIEDLHELIVAFQGYCVRQIEDAGGYVARFAGDGILAYFGYPAAVEDAPQRALHAALALREAREHLAQPDGAPLAVRVGVATGLVVVGDLVSEGARERAVTGETPNLAARLQALADPDTVLVSDTTKRLTDGLFAFRSLGPVSHKGFPLPSVAWEVLGPPETVSRYESRRAVGLSPLVSRERELAAVLEAWGAAQERGGCVVGILGDAGMGKSRLLEEVRRRVGQDGSVLWLEGGGASLYDNTPFYVASQIARGLVAQAAPGEGPNPDPALALEEGGVGGAWKDPERRDELMALTAQRIWSAAERKPIMLVVEDLHWADPSTLELLDLIVKAEGPARVMLIYTSRTDVSDRWLAGVQHRAVELAGLDDRGSAALARAAGGDALSLAQINAIVSRTAGVPLYVEELTRLLAEEPATALDQTLPSTLSDLLAARLEAAGPAKRHAQMASVLGQEFSAALFAAMVETDAADAEAALDDLEARSVIVRRAGDAYAFRHALVAVAAYGTLMRRERRDLHERAAGIIVERHAALADSHPEVVARHWTQAGKFHEALEAWQTAGAAGHARRAFHEAEYAYRQALSVLERAERPDRDRVELRIRAAFNRVLQITQGYSAAEVGLSSQRVAELADRTANPGALATEEQLKWRSVFTAGDYAEAEAIVERVMALTERHGEAAWRQAFVLRAEIQQGFYTGDLARGELNFQAWEPFQDGSHRAAGDDVLSMGIGGLIAQMSGRHSVGWGRIARALDIAARRGNPYDLAMALHLEAGFHHFAEDAAQQAAAADRLAHVAADCGFEYAGHLATGWLGIADLNAGRTASGVERCAEAIKAFDRLGARISQPLWLGFLARAQWLAGDVDEARQTFERALAYNPRELCFIPAAYLARAELLNEAGCRREAERDLIQAARVSRRMGANHPRFRALSALAVMPTDQGRDGRRLQARRAARALAHLDHCPADHARFDALPAD